MRHKHGYRKLNRTSSHRKALLKNLAIALITREKNTGMQEIPTGLQTGTPNPGWKTFAARWLSKPWPLQVAMCRMEQQGSMT